MQLAMATSTSLVHRPASDSALAAAASSVSISHRRMAGWAKFDCKLLDAAIKEKGLRTSSYLRNGRLRASVVAAATSAAMVVDQPARETARGSRAVLPGSPEPFGATARDGGVNFAIFTSGATAAALCLYTMTDLLENRVTEQIPLDPVINKTGDVWHAFLEGDLGDMLYGYKFDGPLSPEKGHYFDSTRVMLDPYAKF